MPAAPGGACPGAATTNPATRWHVAFCPSLARLGGQASASPSLQPTTLGSGGAGLQCQRCHQCQQCHQCHGPPPGERGRTPAPTWSAGHRGRRHRLKPSSGCPHMCGALALPACPVAVASHRARTHSTARMAEPPGRALPDPHRGSPGDSRCRREQPRWAAAPAQAGICRHCLEALPGTWVPVGALHQGAGAHTQPAPLGSHWGLPFTRSAPCSARLRPPSGNVEAMVFPRLGASCAPAWVSQHWEDPAPSWDTGFPLVPGHLSQRSLTLALPKPPRTLPAAQPHAHPAPPKGLMPLLEGPTEHLGAPARAGSAADSCPFPGASRGARAAPLLLPAEPLHSRRSWAPLPRSPGAADAMHPWPVGAGGRARPWGERPGSQVTAVTLQDARVLGPGPRCSASRLGQAAARGAVPALGQRSKIWFQMRFPTWVRSKGGGGPGAAGAAGAARACSPNQPFFFVKPYPSTGCL